MALGSLPRRINPRRRTILRLESGKLERERVTNLSANGMFVEGHQLLDAQKGALWIPGDDRPLEVKIRATFARPHGVGVLFDPSDRRTRQELIAYVTHQREQARLERMERRLHDGEAVNLKPMNEDLGTRLVLRPIERSGATLELYSAIEGRALPARLAAVDPINARLSVLLDAGHASGRPDVPGEFDEVFMVLRHGGVAYLADTVVERTSGVLSSVMLPERIFLPERRLMEREVVPQGGILRFELDGRTVIAEVVQHDANGLCALLWTADARALGARERLEGARLSRVDGDTPLEPLRVVWKADTEEDGRVRIGFQRMLSRVPVPVEEIALEHARRGAVARAWSGVQHVVGGWLGRIGVGHTAPPPLVWTLPDGEGRPVVALVNATFDVERPPPGRIAIILLPPPFARRKEILGPVALALVETFRAAGEHAIVVRYDGMNHVGESWKDEASSSPDSAMLHWTLTQTVRDLATVHQGVRAKLGARATPTAIVSFSMSAVATRRYLAEGAAGVDYWIAPMGAPDPRDIIKNSSGGIDWVGDRARGRALGVNLIQGHLLDCDRGCDDMLGARIAELEDARREMAQVKQPVTWLCGLHDYWVNVHRVEDILGVEAAGSRELIRVPTGHFVRQSEEALEVFRIIAARVASRLLGREVDARLPPTHVLTRAADMERTRRESAPFDAKAYWTSYLAGTQRNPLGFDLLALTDEYAELMDDQVDLLELESDDRVIDLGCGTGNGLAALVRRWAAVTPGLQIDAVDFVPSAMDRARQKVLEAAREVGVRVPAVRFQEADLSLPPDYPNLPYGDSAFDAVLLSLVVPYLREPQLLLREIHRILLPGGRLVVSTLRPDVDMGGPLKRLKEKVEAGDQQLVDGWHGAKLLAAVQDYVNAAARLIDLEMDGRFRFYEREAFEDLLRGAGFRVERAVASFGNPAAAIVIVAVKPDG